MPTNKYSILARLAICTITFFSGFGAEPVSAQNPRGIQLRNDLSWHGVSNRIQVHQPSVEANPPYIHVWQRIAIGNNYDNLAYVKNLIDCQEWTQIPFMTIDWNGYFVFWKDSPNSVKAAWEAHGKDDESVMTAVCSMYGYTKHRGELPPHTDKKGNFVER